MFTSVVIMSDWKHCVFILVIAYLPVVLVGGGVVAGFAVVITVRLCNLQIQWVNCYGVTVFVNTASQGLLRT